MSFINFFLFKFLFFTVLLAENLSSNIQSFHDTYKIGLVSVLRGIGYTNQDAHDAIEAIGLVYPLEVLQDGSYLILLVIRMNQKYLLLILMAEKH